MIKYENGCVDCGKPCLGIGCPYYREEHFYCDCCGEEYAPDELYFNRNEAWCEACIMATYTPAYNE